MAFCRMFFLLALAAVLAPATGAQVREHALEAVLSATLPPTESKVVKYKTPIVRVIDLLKKMKAELSKDSASDEEMYDKMVCWCETNDKEKTAAIKEAEMKDADLSSEIEARSAKFGEAATEIEHLKKEIAANKEALKEAMAVREKGLSEFRGDETEMTQNIVNLKNAIAVLSKHNTEGASFMQMDAPVLSSLRSVLHDLTEKREMLHARMRERGINAKPVLLSMNMHAYNQKKLSSEAQSLMSALDTSGFSAGPLSLEIAQHFLAISAEGVPRGLASGFLQTGEKQPYSSSFKSYYDQSGPIYGILTQMLEEFEASLAYDQKQELKSGKDAEELMAAKEAEIEAGKKKLDEMEEAHAANTKALGDAKEELQDVRDQRSADVEFLQNLKVTCQGLDRQFQDRTKTRSLELAAVTETIKILTEDDAMDLLRQTVKLLQVRAESRELRVRRRRAVAALRKAAKESGIETDDLEALWHDRRGDARASPLRGMQTRMQLSTLALSASLDSFTKVKAMMDTMVADLKAEQQEEVDFKANCTAEFDNTEKELYDLSEEKKALETEIDTLAKEIAKLTGEIKDAKEMIATSEVEIKKAGGMREEENAAFQKSVVDQRATQAILKKALLRMKEYYKKEKGGASLAQQSRQEPPVKFQKYTNNKGASPVIGLIEQIIEDSEEIVAEGFKEEQGAQAGYEKLVLDTNAIIAELSAEIKTKTKLIAEHTESSESAKGDLFSTEEVLASKKEYEANVHADCDWVMKNFAIRQKARLAEIEAIQAAKAILAGAK